MKARLLLPGLLWTTLMILIFVTPISSPELVYLNFIPPRAIIHGLLFLIHVHIWLGICKKQWYNKRIKKYALPLTIISAVLLLFCAELLAMQFQIRFGFDPVYMLGAVLGSITGIVTFKLLYRTCL